jgi:ribonuclease VapC
MVLDSSAIFAILFNEKDAERYARAIEQDTHRLISVGNLLECDVVARRKHGDAMVRELDALLHEMRCEPVAFTEDQLDVARNAFGKYGATRHAAGLNFGDCFAYALAQISGEPLLFKGNDFALTDVVSATVPEL